MLREVERRAAKRPLVSGLKGLVVTTPYKGLYHLCLNLDMENS